jgi:rhomboid family protein
VRVFRGKPDFRVRSWRKGRRLALPVLISVNVAVFATQCWLEFAQPGFVRDYLALSSQGVHDAYSWQFIAAIFLHLGPVHFLSSVLALYFLGPDVECILGQRHFVSLYFAGAIAGEFAHLFFMPSNVPLFAGSGGVAATLAAYATALPELDLFSRPIPFVGSRLKTKHFALGALVIAALFMIFDRNGAVIQSAVLGGCIAGWGYAHFLGFGSRTRFSRALEQRRVLAQQRERMSAAEFITHEIDPLLEKITRRGIRSLTREERCLLGQAREKILRK